MAILSGTSSANILAYVHQHTSHVCSPTNGDFFYDFTTRRSSQGAKDDVINMSCSYEIKVLLIICCDS